MHAHTHTHTCLVGSDDQRLLWFSPALLRARGDAEDVGLLCAQARDGELPRVGAHLHRGELVGVAGVQPVRDLITCTHESEEKSRVRKNKSDLSSLNSKKFKFEEETTHFHRMSNKLFISDWTRGNLSYSIRIGQEAFQVINF